MKTGTVDGKLRTMSKLVWTLALAVVFVGGWGLSALAEETADLGVPRSSMDLRPEFAKRGMEIRPQGGRGTCSVFAMTEAIEYALSGRKGAKVRLSVEFLNWASNQVTKQANDGSFFSDLWAGYEAYGVCPEGDLAYQPAFNPNLKPGDLAIEHAKQYRNLGLRMHWIKPWDVTTGLKAEQLIEIKRTLCKQWPVCAGLRWPKAEQYKDGVLMMAPPEGVRDGHSVILVGFRDDSDQPGGGVFLFRNSSGAREGQMTYEYARAYMNDAIWIDFGTTESAMSDSKSVMDCLNPMTIGPAGRNRRVSSNQQPEWHTENLDMTWLQPGKSVEMPVFEGPGIITHMWFTSHSGWVSELNTLCLRIYWDGNPEPGVEAPLGDFFAVGHGKPAVVESVPVQVSITGSLSCYWRMPFRKSAKIVITNDNPDRGTGLYWQVDYTQVEALPESIPYFYARYRQEYPAVAGRDYLFADLVGKGFYVGSVQSITSSMDGWFGEGDDFFYIDGEEVPSLQGTGTEDYYNDAWGFRPRTSHWFGNPRWQGDSAGDSGVCYRWHLPDPIFFAKSLKATIEHRGNTADDTGGFFLERPDFVSSVAFWYQEGQPKDFEPMPPYPQRRVPWVQHHLVRTFQKAKITGDAKLIVDTTGFFGARPVLLWPNKSAGASLTLPFSVEQDGRFAVRLTAASGPGYGLYDIEVDSKKIMAADFHAAEDNEADLLLGTLELSKGDHTISFKAPADSARVKPLAVELLRLLKLPPEPRRDPKTHHEAHFVRLGIGRAIYAYRLAYGEIPDSLETLVKSGIMPARYLNDENNKPLKCHREGDFLVVESDGPEPWKHQWQGLDARR
ncbi:MAG: DUF2961 domain-containing protein [Phycisphaerae bacterium]|nr:DUF2961 domain-containing protein [Phycisphaerae bacterium]